MNSSIPRRIARKLRKLLISYPRRVECNLCGWRGRHMISDDWHPHTICPQCRSEVRHRLLIAAMTQLEDLQLDRLARDRSILHFAPEPVIGNIFGDVAHDYLTADLLREGTDLKLDLCDMADLRDESFDMLVACDVLEHVPDDGKAMDEIHRVLRPGGWAVLTVPQKDGLESTYEDPTITSEQGRLEAFGQEDHLRIYGDDFPGILERHGFEVVVVDENSFSAEATTKNVLFPPVLSTHPLATNYRKVFFAKRISARQ